MLCRKRFALLSLGAVLAASQFAFAAEPPKPLRAGIIGLDTSHVVAFTETLNDPKAPADLMGVKIVAAFPGGSPDIPDSANRIVGFTEKLRGMDVEIVDSIDELLNRVDVILLESVDGRRHLAQAKPVIEAGRPLFIDKPMAASLADAMRIFRLAEAKKVPVFSSSSLRYVSSYQGLRNGTLDFGTIRKCTAWSPMNLESHHPDLFWYAIHGVESLYTIMGTGCKTVTRAGPEEVVGVWSDGRQGVFQGKGKKQQYGALVEGSKETRQIGKSEGYVPLLQEIVKFFKTGKAPVAPAETLEILAFMEAADESKRQGGELVSIESVMQKAEAEVKADGQ